MSHTQNQQVDALEKAILARADELASEFKRKAESQRDNLLRESNERLHLEEEREVLAAKAEADRVQRRQVQANELKLQAHLDQLRWQMVLSVQEKLKEKMAARCADKSAYHEWLVNMLKEATELIPEGDLTAEGCSCDFEWLEAEWDDIAAKAAPGRKITLSHKPIWGSGGLKVRNKDNTAQVDNRFEGRLNRMQHEVQRVILERLFPGDLSTLHSAG